MQIFHNFIATKTSPNNQVLTPRRQTIAIHLLAIRYTNVLLLKFKFFFFFLATICQFNISRGLNKNDLISHSRAIVKTTTASHSIFLFSADCALNKLNHQFERLFRKLITIKNWCAYSNSFQLSKNSISS